jgi:hypothetical protein
MGRNGQLLHLSGDWKAVLVLPLPREEYAMTHPHATADDAEYRAAIQDAATESARYRNDALRRLETRTDDEIAMLERALAGDLSPYTPAGVRTMQTRLVYLRAARGFVPTIMGVGE